ncbi:MAG: CpsD/CapB family tyrosine-protein kinase [Armatimonadetes bacterium]|nr:CpsD/CapB family tyrosine-protein kinase [Armatimonadota bacterium]
MLPTTDTFLGPAPPNSAFLEGFRVLRANLLGLWGREPFKTVLVTSAQAREGKTTVAANLATVLALAGKQTIAVDADANLQGLSRACGLRGRPGLTDLCAGNMTADEVLCPTQVDTLKMVPAGTQVDRASELMLSEHLHQAIRQIADMSEFVIIDAMPAVGFGATLSLAPLTDRVLVVARARGDAQVVKQALGSLHDVGANIAGIVVNDINPQDSAIMTSYYRYYYQEEE